MADPGEGPGGPATPYFATKMRPKGPKKKMFLEAGPPPYLRVWMNSPPPRPLSEGLDPPLFGTVLDSGLYAGFRIPGTGFQSLPVELGFWIP